MRTKINALEPQVSQALKKTSSNMRFAHNCPSWWKLACCSLRDFLLHMGKGRGKQLHNRRFSLNPPTRSPFSAKQSSISKRTSSWWTIYMMTSPPSLLMGTTRILHKNFSPTNWEKVHGVKLLATTGSRRFLIHPHPENYPRKCASCRRKSYKEP